MSSAEQKKRLKQLADALVTVEGMNYQSLPAQIRRVLYLLDACPWLSGDDGTPPALSGAPLRPPRSPVGPPRRLPTHAKPSPPKEPEQP